MQREMSAFEDAVNRLRDTLIHFETVEFHERQVIAAFRELDNRRWKHIDRLAPDLLLAVIRLAGENRIDWTAREDARAKAAGFTDAGAFLLAAADMSDGEAWRLYQEIFEPPVLADAS